MSFFYMPKFAVRTGEDSAHEPRNGLAANRQLDARTKLLFTLLFTLLVFIVDKFPVVVFLLLFSVVIRIAAGVSFNNFQSLKNLTLLAALIILMQMFFGPGDAYIVKPLFPPSFPLLGGYGCIKRDGLILGVVIALRLAALVIILPVFTETTPPYKIAAGLCAAGLSCRIAFIITMAFNLISFFKDEALVIMDAQKLRGANSFEKRKTLRGSSQRAPLLSRFKAYAGLLLPLMLGAMRKAQRSCAAMDSRAFDIYKKRTWIDKPVMETRDFACIIGCIIMFTGVLFINFKLL